MKDNQSSDDEWLRKQFEWIRRAEKAVGMTAHKLSPAEFAVASLQVAGKSLTEIAAMRGKRHSTIESQLRTTRHKLGVRNRASLAAALQKLKAAEDA